MNIHNIQFIVDQDPAKFKGYAYNTMSNGVVHNMHKPMNLEEYKNEKGIPTLVAVSYTEYEEKYEKPLAKSLQKPFEEIDAEEYHRLLNVMLPLRWHTINRFNVFFLAEEYGYGLHSCVVKTEIEGVEKYFTALRPVNITDGDLMENMCKEITTTKKS